MNYRKIFIILRTRQLAALGVFILEVNIPPHFCSLVSLANSCVKIALQIQTVHPEVRSVVPMRENSSKSTLPLPSRSSESSAFLNCAFESNLIPMLVIKALDFSNVQMSIAIVVNHVENSLRLRDIKIRRRDRSPFFNCC